MADNKQRRASDKAYGPDNNDLANELLRDMGKMISKSSVKIKLEGWHAVAAVATVCVTVTVIVVVYKRTT